MRESTTKVLPAREYEVFSYTCDLCGGSADDPNGGTFRSKTRIYTYSGEVWPEGGSVTQKSLDCCARCFEDRVLPALLAIGFPGVHEIEREF